MPERFYCVEQLSENQHLTPEGFLVIENTPIARTGMQDYAPSELPLERYDFTPAPDGVYHVMRKPEEVFHPRAVLSANGKAVTNDHPWEDVTIDNYHSLSIGDIYNPRRSGEMLVVDMIIKRREGLDFVRGMGKRELSCGYDVDYYEIEPGRLEQRNIRINHVALVDRGRCGPSCAIADHAHRASDHELDLSTEEEAEMAAAARSTSNPRTDNFFKRLRTAFDAAGDPASNGPTENMGLDTEGEGGGPFKVENHIYAGAPGEGARGDRRMGDAEGETEKRVEKLEKDVKAIGDNVKGMRDSLDKFLKGRDAEEDPDKKKTDDEEEDPDKKKTDDESEGEKEKEKAKDKRARDARVLAAELVHEVPSGMTADQLSRQTGSTFLAPSYRDTVAGAEVLSPGIEVFSFSESEKASKTFDSICKLRRTALDAAYKQSDTRHMIDAVVGAGRALDTAALTCSEARNLFRAVVGMKRSANDARTRTFNGGLENAGGGDRAIKPVSNLVDYQRQLDKFYGKQA